MDAEWDEVLSARQVKALTVDAVLMRHAKWVDDFGALPGGELVPCVVCGRRIRKYAVGSRGERRTCRALGWYGLMCTNKLAYARRVQREAREADAEVLVRAVELQGE